MADELGCPKGPDARVQKVGAVQARSDEFVAFIASSYEALLYDLDERRGISDLPRIQLKYRVDSVGLRAIQRVLSSFPLILPSRI